MRKILLIHLFLLLTLPVQAKERVVLSSLEWPPFTSATLPNQGFFNEIVIEAMAREGYAVEIEYVPWARAVLRAKQGKSDGVSFIYFSEERLNYFSYTVPIFRSNEDFVTVQGTDFNWNGDFSSIKNNTVSVLRGSIAAQKIEGAGIQVMQSADQVDDMNLVLKGRIDAMLIPHQIFFYRLKKQFPDFDRTQIRVATPPMNSYKSYVVFSKKHPHYQQLTAAFNRGFSTMQADGTLDEILNRAKERWGK